MAELTNAERVCATILFYFQSGLDAGKVLEEGKGRRATIRNPSEEDLLEVKETQPRSRWDAVMEDAEVLVANIITTEPRDALTLVKEVGAAIKKGKETLAKVTGPVRPIGETFGRKR